MKFIKELNLKNKRILLRTDLNIPIKNDKIAQDFRLKAILPTIRYIQANNGKIILATHIGRPKNYNEKLSTKILLNWFKKNGFQIKFENNLEKAEKESKQNFNEILLLENLRFFAGEKGTEKEREIFAQKLKKIGDIYVNDAFALTHRNDTSVTLLPQKFKFKNSAFGLLVEKEIAELNKLKNNVKQPFILVLGGNKVKDKINLLSAFLNAKKENRPESILIGGAMSYTFLKTKNIETGKSLIDHDNLNFAKNFLIKAQEKNINILLPIDHVSVKNIKNIKEIKVGQLEKNDIGVDIGPETIKIFTNQIKTAKTIFTNGPMGIYTENKLATGSRKILGAIANSNAYSIAGGGDCVAAIFKFNLENKFSFLSTGGGATLAYLGK